MNKFKFNMELVIEAEDFEDAWVRWSQWMKSYADYLRHYQQNAPEPTIHVTMDQVVFTSRSISE